MTPRPDEIPNTLLSPDERHALLHDLRTPLTVLNGHAQLLERWVQNGRSCPPETTLVVLERISGCVQDMRQRLTRLEADAGG